MDESTQTNLNPDSAKYHDHLVHLRRSFPQPIASPTHDRWLASEIIGALTRIESMKSDRPTLGDRTQGDFSHASAARMPEDSSTIPEVFEVLVNYLSGMFLWGHPQTQSNVIPPPSIPAILGTLLTTIHNPNLCSEEGSQGVALAEAEVISMTAALMGYDPEQSDGVFTFGGTGTLLYAIRIGIEKSCPGTAQHGITDRPVVLCSDRAHYATKTAASWLGLGLEQVIAIPSTSEHSMRLDALQQTLCDVLGKGQKVAAIIATMGTTDAFGIDPLEEIRKVRDQVAKRFHLPYLPHLHADAVIGWAWSVFADYDFETNPLGFPEKTLDALTQTNHRVRHLGQADSIGVDYHKTGFASYVSSAIFTKERKDLQRISRDATLSPYLFQTGDYNPGRFTLETSRSGSGPMSAIGSLRLLGKTGLRCLLGHLVTVAADLRDQLSTHPSIVVVNRQNHGPVTLFRVYPDGIEKTETEIQERNNRNHTAVLRKHNEYNRQIFHQLRSNALQGEGTILSMTDCYRESENGEPIVALKSYIMSPFSDSRSIETLVNSIDQARQAIAT
ncbi:L-2,4-diaminobutyrate decarboxylase [Roseimaritima multifibrata]|uniref:L-2,4-diaminobutyrate decarboxylase n=1 Tax=Roseimaritima multifibrata TaxID=1930274 RepID=A0A517MFC1_9BACT|nr:pyridoxal-dependent decarboxylase [Roseimaritima multifibrata]QDS93584.1 L-2,4-diaminobutyrate decarboxylase [Roseimaritima multifibrata]